MSSRTQPRHLITTSAPTSAQVGDEYFNPSTNKLFKRLVLGGTLAGYEEVPVLSQVVSISNTTSAFSSTTGALTVAGGAGITGNLFIGGNLTVTGSFSGSVTASGVTGGTAGQLVYQSGVSTTAFAGPGTAGQILTSGGTGAPTYVTTTTLFVGNSVTATNVRAGTAGQLVYQSAPGVTAFAGPGTAGQILTSGGTGAPTYVTTTTLYVGRALVADSATGGAGTANNIAGGILGQIPYQLAAGSTAFIGTGTAGTILQMGANTATFVATSTIYINRAVLADNDSGGAAGGLRYQTGANASTFLSIGTAGQMLRVNSGATAPEWLSTGSIYVGFANQANNLLAGTAGQLVYQSAAGTTAFAGPGTAGQLLVSAGTSAPTYTNTGSIYVGFANQSNNLLAGTAGQIVYQSAAGTTAFAGPGSAGNVLTSNGTSAPSYVTTTSLYVGRAVVADSATGGSASATNIAGGTAGQVPYQTGAGATSFFGPGTAGQILTSGGTGAPTYVATTTVYVNRAVLADNDSGGAAGGLRYQTGANASTFLSIGTAGQMLRVNAGATAPEWLSTGSIYVGFANQANNLLAGANGSIPYQTAAGATTMLSVGASNSILVSNGTVPSWTVNPTIGGNVTITGNLTVQGTTVTVDSTVTNVSDPIFTVGTAAGGGIPITDDGRDRGIAFVWTGTQAGLNTNRTGFFGFDRSTLYFTFITSASITNEVVAPAGGTTRGAIDANLAGGTAGQLVYQSAANTTAFAGPGTAGQVLTSGGTGAPTYVTTTTLYVGRALVADSATGGSASANNIAGGTAGQVPYQTGAGATSFFGPGTAGQILTSGGTGAPTYVATTTVYVNRAVLADNDSGGAAGGLRYQTGANASTFLSIGTAGQILRVNAGATAPEWISTASVYSGASVSSQNLFGGTAGQLHYQSGVGTTAFAGPGTAGQILVSAGTSAPTYTSTGSIYVNRAVLADNDSGGAAGGLRYQTGANASTFLAIGTAGQMLRVNAGATAPEWVSTGSFYSAAAVSSQNIFGGTTGQLHYQSGVGTTAFAGPGTAGQILVSAGAAAPVYTSTSSIYVNNAVRGDTILTTARPNAGLHYLTFVDANNASATAEVVYTTSTFNLDPRTGNVAIGTTATSNKFEVAGVYGQLFSVADTFTGTIFAASDISGIPSIEVLDTGLVKLAQYNGQVTINTATSISSSGLTAWTATWVRSVIVNQNGRIGSLGVGTDASGTTGEIRATNEITAYYSDRRLKENVQLIDDALTKVLSLHGITYTPNSIAETFGYDKTKQLVGVFADEVNRVLPQAVRPAPFDLNENGESKSGQNYKTVQYEKLVPLLIEAIKEQQGLINKLQADLRQLKIEIQSMR